MVHHEKEQYLSSSLTKVDSNKKDKVIQLTTSFLLVFWFELPYFDVNP